MVSAALRRVNFWNWVYTPNMHVHVQSCTYILYIHTITHTHTHTHTHCTHIVIPRPSLATVFDCLQYAPFLPGNEASTHTHTVVNEQHLLRSGESGRKDEGKRGGEGERRKVILRQEKEYRDRFISPFPFLAKLLTVKLSMNNVYCQ